MNINGDPQKRTEAALMALALSWGDDMDAGGHAWAVEMPRAYRGMLAGQGWEFDPIKQQWITDHGRTISPAEQKRISLTLAAAVSLDMQNQTRRMIDGNLEAGQWQDVIGRDTANLLIAQAALAAGGIDEITPSIQASIIGDIADETGLVFSLSRLQSFATDVASGQMNEAAILHRAGLYGLSSNTIYEQSRGISHAAALSATGSPLFGFERNVLSDVLHCPECPALTNLGWVKIGTLPEPGTRICAMNCWCYLEYSATGDEE
jgi:hypothetical protein